jgi:peptidoglycan-associated lipoprotein
MRRIVTTLMVTALAVTAGSACATKGYVGTQVGEVNQKVETLAQSLEENQERTRRNEARIGEVDEKAESAGRSAAEAHSAAELAYERAERAEEVARASQRLIYEVVLSSDQANFAFGRAQLPDPAKEEIDQLVERLRSNARGAFIEIEGHTDSTGPRHVNERLGLQRAESVKRYLYEEHQVPLHRMNVISYGPEKPIAPNNTRDGRAQNRRVVIRVLEPEGLELEEAQPTARDVSRVPES